MGSPSSDGNNALDEDRNFCDAQARAKIRMAPSAASFASMRRLYCQGVSQDESVMESVPGRTTVAGPRGRRKAGGDGRGGCGMIPFKPRDCGAGERERVNVRRLSVPVRPFALEPSELDAGAGGGGLGARGGFRFDSPPLLRVSTFMEPRLPITVCASSSVSSSSVLTPDAELEQNVRQRRVSPPLLPAFLATVRSHVVAHDNKIRGNVMRENRGGDSPGGTRLIARAPVKRR
jgi:hypothetical protein